MNKNNNNYFSWIIILLLLFLFVCVIFFQLLFKIETYDSANNTKQSKQNNKLNVIYINLDSRKDRNEQMIQELEGFCKEYTRLSASYNEQGYLGCSESHIRSIQFAIEKNARKLFEDRCI